MNKEKYIQVLDLIAYDQEKDSKDFEGAPFDGRTVATYFGYQGAAIASLANILKEVIKEMEE